MCVGGGGGGGNTRHELKKCVFFALLQVSVLNAFDLQAAGGKPKSTGLCG